MRTHREDGHLWRRKRALTTHGICWRLILDVQPLERTCQCLWFKPASQWYIYCSAQMDGDRLTPWFHFNQQPLAVIQSAGEAEKETVSTVPAWRSHSLEESVLAWKGEESPVGDGSSHPSWVVPSAARGPAWRRGRQSVCVRQENGLHENVKRPSVLPYASVQKTTQYNG